MLMWLFEKEAKKALAIMNDKFPGPGGISIITEE